jgi:hypothetical protein
MSNAMKEHDETKDLTDVSIVPEVKKRRKS